MRSLYGFLIQAVLICAATATFAAAAEPSKKVGPLLQLLEARNYEELDRQVMSAQRGYAQGTVSELDLLQTFRGFYTTDPALHARFNEWVQRYPRSYASRLARGIYYKRLGTEARGERYAAETAEWSFRRMEAYFEKAMADLEASLDRDPKPILSYLYMMDIQKYSGPWSIKVWLFRFHLYDPNEYTLKQALEVAPNSFILRRKYMLTLQVRWGGAYGAMEAFLAECRKAKLQPDEHNMLEALVRADRGWVLYSAREFAGAFDAYQKAGALVDYKSDRLFEHGMRGPFIHGVATGYQGAQRHAEALSLFNQAIEAGENSAEIYLSRGISLHHLGRKKEGVEDYLRAAELGNAWAQNEIGKYYWHGVILEQSREQAIKWFARAADQGSADGKKNLEWARKL